VTKELQHFHSADIVHRTHKVLNILNYNTLRDTPEVLVTGVALKPADIFAFAMLVVEVVMGQFRHLAHDTWASTAAEAGEWSGTRLQRWCLGSGSTLSKDSDSRLAVATCKDPVGSGRSLTFYRTLTRMSDLNLP
ncbi:hypothetical protein BDM02DRAFT_3133402, partial [Thelephora ganbajun]